MSSIVPLSIRMVDMFSYLSLFYLIELAHVDFFATPRLRTSKSNYPQKEAVENEFLSDGGSYFRNFTM